MSTYREFQEALRATGRYETASTHRPAVQLRISTLNSFRYAFTIIRICARCAIKHLLRKFGYEEWAKTCMASVAFAEKLGGVVTFEGFEQRAAYKGPVVYVSNHMSTLETMVFPTTLLSFGKLAIVLKKSLTEIPLVGTAALAVGSIAVTRKNAREDLKTVLEEGAKRLAEGHSVLLFPQGTRQAVFDGKKFNSLGSKLAERAGVPVVPLAVKTDFLKTGKWIKDFGEVDPNKPIRFVCGPVLPAALGARATHDQSVAFIGGQLKAWGLPTVETEPA
ncbi:MAG TPA: lysophospholipid acyltransferase family protein [Kiritimatiellia bacterium]|nr:lysophospholipid acyltransferase family protein [Kiritimatiellia bacterium]HPS08789.1 lysophospholipid acyltransferase family protein [Kiritimatiellia bacterium]